MEVESLPLQIFLTGIEVGEQPLCVASDALLIEQDGVKRPGVNSPSFLPLSRRVDIWLAECTTVGKEELTDIGSLDAALRFWGVLNSIRGTASSLLS